MRRESLLFGLFGLFIASFSVGCSQDSSNGSDTPDGGGDGGVSPASLRPVKCMCYTPTPSDYANNHGGGQKYYDSDFENDDFAGLWGSYLDPQSSQDIGRHDLRHLSQDLGVNFLRLYDWNSPPGRNHIPFFDECNLYGIRITVPISNYFVGLVQKNDPTAAPLISAIVKEVYASGKKPHPAAALWLISNEYELSAGAITADGIAQTAALLIQAEDALGVAAADRLPITSSVSFAVKPPAADPSISAIVGLQTAFANRNLGSVFAARFWAGINIYSPGSVITPYVQTTFPKNFMQQPMPLFFSEMGQNSDATNGGEAGQASFEMGQLAAVLPLAKDASQTVNGYFLGACMFQWNDQLYKGGTEAEYGLQKYAPGTAPTAKTKSGQTYPIDALSQKSAYSSVQSAFRN